MAKARSGRKTASGKKKKAPSPADNPPAVDMRLIEALMGQVVNARNTDDSLQEAQEIMWDAWDHPSRKRRIALARRALKVSSLCADAYVLLAMEDASNEDEALSLYRQGVEAGEKALGEAAFDEDVGHFWGILETRPYMRARQGLAEALWVAGQRDEAVAHYQDMLRLNPNDNQGIRYLLLDYLLALGRDDEAAALIKRYKNDGAAAWIWSKALLSFRTKGDSEAARKALRQAIASNAHIPAYLLGRKKMPRQLPAYISPGSVDEAVAYVHTAAEAWATTPDALHWLHTAQSASASRRRRSSAAKKP